MPGLIAVWFLVMWHGFAQSHAPARAAENGAVEYYYRFDNPQLDVVRSELQFDERGVGSFRFQTKEQAEAITTPLQLLPETIAKIQRLMGALRFLESNGNYQGERDFSYLGVSTIRVKKGLHVREANFNFSRNPSANELASLLRSVTYQEYRVFTIDLARRHDPLDLDRQMRALEREIKNGWFPEPKKLLEMMRVIAADPDLLVMVRRRAESIVRSIEKMH